MKIAGIVAILLLLAVTTFALSTSTLNQKYTKSTRSVFHDVVNEGQQLNYIDYASQMAPGQLVRIELVTDMPLGGSYSPQLPYSGFSDLESTFSWTPTFCQSKPQEYLYKVDTFSGPIQTDSIDHYIQVANVNRAPVFNKDAMFPCGPARRNVMVNQPVNVPIIATDLDKTQCGDTNEITLSVMNMQPSPSKKKVALGARSEPYILDPEIDGSGTLVWTPSTADVGKTFTLTVSANDNQGAITQMQFQLCVNSQQGSGVYVSEGPCRQLMCY